MLIITVPAIEMWDDEKQEFVIGEGQNLRLEHSLASISKWESKWHKPFLSKKDKTDEEALDYIKCMTLEDNVDPSIYERLTVPNIQQINAYIDDSMTATTFPEGRTGGGRPSREQVTAELIYYWMFNFHIPLECQEWHLNRLLTLIRVCEVKSQPPKKMSRSAISRRNRDLNAARRRQFNTNG